MNQEPTREESIILSSSLSMRGKVSKTICPYCSSRRKNKRDRCLTVTDEGNRILYNCWHCNESGVVFKENNESEYNSQAHSNTYQKTKSYVQSQAKINDCSKKEEAIVMPEIKTRKLSDVHVEWLKTERGISEKTATDAGLFTVEKFLPRMKRNADTITFPYINEGKMYAAKHRGPQKSFLCSGAPRTLWGIEKASEDEALYITEGEIDALCLMEAGVKNVVSIPNGAVEKIIDRGVHPSEDTKFMYLWESKEFFEKCKKIILCLDDDLPGEVTSQEIARRIGKAKCWKMEWPEGCKDANDVLKQSGPDGLAKALENHHPFPVAGLYSANEFADSVNDLYDKGLGKGESTGYRDVDELYSIVTGEMSIVTGIPGSGKSEFVDQIMVNLAAEKGWKFAVCSFENHPKLHIAKLISKREGKSFFDGFIDRIDRAQLNRSFSWVNDHFTFLHYSDGSLSHMDDIIERLKAAVMRYGVRGAVVDPYNYIQRSPNKEERDNIDDMLVKLRTFAVSYGVHVWFVAHPRKMSTNLEGKVQVPVGYDISGAAGWFNHADAGVTVHRPDKTETATEIHIWKIRFSWNGKCGVAGLEFDPESFSYSGARTPWKEDPFITDMKSSADNVINFHDREKE